MDAAQHASVVMQGAPGGGFEAEAERAPAQVGEYGAVHVGQCGRPRGGKTRGANDVPVPPSRTAQKLKAIQPLTQECACEPGCLRSTGRGSAEIIIPHFGLLYGTLSPL